VETFMVMINRREFMEATAAALLAANGRGLFAADRGSEPSLCRLPTIPYGAVYFRKSNPPREDWGRDYAQAAADGMNCFRHWFLWSAIEVSPGKYDWGDYDRQLDLAAKHGLKTIVADILCTAPQWAFKRYPQAWVERADGTRQAPHYTIACAVGGWPGLCLDNEEVRVHAEQFLRALVERYRDHPAMGGYDVWDDVEIPRTNDPYPDSIDWALFRIDNAVRLFEWRVGLIRSLDTVHPVTAHAIPMGAIKSIGPATYPLFQAGRLVDVYGYSGGCNHEEWTPLRWRPLPSDLWQEQATMSTRAPR
jgi:beta-galactosidase